MHIDLKIEALSGAGLNNIPILASRQFVSDITVKNNETALLVSALSKSESAAVSGLPGLGELPGFQSTTADTIGETDSSDLVLLITPHVIRRRSSIVAGPRIALNLPHEPD
jgi:type II secretory pathway component GspD/PulD (secretin)